MPRPALSDAVLTAVILTRNEAARLPRCLAAIPDRYAVLVLDSGSTDSTVEVAAAAGCAVARNPWPGFAAQRNVALQQCGIESPWVLFVDADEVHPPAFFDWFETTARDCANFDVAMVSSTLVFKGVVLRHAPGYPIYHPRLVRRGAVTFLPNHLVHGETVADGARLITVDIPYAHYFYDGNLQAWLLKHVGLAVQEAFPPPLPDRHVSVRGRLGRLARRMPLRPLLRFAYHYVVCGGFRDGRAGLEYSLMYAWFEGTKSLLRFARLKA